MITLDYYDDNTVRDNAVFFTLKKIYAFVIASCLSLGFSIYKLYKIEIEGNTQTAQKAFFITLLAMGFITVFIFMFIYFFGGGDNELYSRTDLMKLRRNYESERKKVLEEHKYNYSIFTICCNSIGTEILCDSFSVDNKGHVYIMNSDFDTVLDESNYIKPYHHIVDNRDGHTLTVKELKEKYLSENINGKSPENNKSESKSHSNDSRNDKSN